MLLDVQTLVSDKQAITVTALSTNAIDLGVAGSVPGIGPSGVAGVPIHDVGRGNPVQFECQVTTAFTAAGAATLQVQMVVADDAALGTNLLVIQESIAIGKAVLIPGKKFTIGGTIPPGIAQRFLGLNFVVATGPMTAGNILAGVVIDRQTNPSV